MAIKIKIIAEVGVNHNGKISWAKKLIDQAKQAGADYVKFQAFSASQMIIKGSKLADYQKKTKFKSQYEMIKKYELNKKQIRELKIYSKKKKINFLCSPFDTENLDILFKLRLKTIKVASGEIDNYQLLDKISSKAKSVFLSSGMSTIQEIKLAIKILTKHKIKKKNIVVMHCTSNYPTIPKDINMRALQTIKKVLKVNVGYSDHSQNVETGIIAAACGATVIEKHITINKKYSGPDHSSSLDLMEFRKYVKLIRLTEDMLGSKNKKPNLKELKIKKVVRKSIYAKKYIKKGEKFTHDNLICKRPQSTMPASKWFKIMNKISNKNYRTDQPIKL
jgi:N,N'-diacetyllegionaminate synthase